MRLYLETAPSPPHHQLSPTGNRLLTCFSQTVATEWKEQCLKSFSFLYWFPGILNIQVFNLSRSHQKECLRRPQSKWLIFLFVSSTFSPFFFSLYSSLSFSPWVTRGWGGRMDDKVGQDASPQRKGCWISKANRWRSVPPSGRENLWWQFEMPVCSLVFTA